MEKKINKILPNPIIETLTRRLPILASLTFNYFCSAQNVAAVFYDDYDGGGGYITETAVKFENKKRERESN